MTAAADCLLLWSVLAYKCLKHYLLKRREMPNFKKVCEKLTNCISRAKNLESLRKCAKR